MSKEPKKRLCWNCEGNISAADEQCPYCGVSVRPLSVGEDTHGSSMSPPYRLGTESGEHVPRSPYAEKESESNAHEDVESKDKRHSVAETEDPLKDFKIVTVTIISLLTGMVFFLFGTLLLVFSRNGILTLSWDGSFWFVYMIIGIPLLIYGWYQLHSIKD